MLEVWTCDSKGDNWVTVDEERHGIFFDHNCYVCHYIYEERNARKIKSRIYFWEGRNAVNKAYISYRFGFAEELAAKMAELDSDVPEEIRVLQHKEPEHFLNIFGGQIVIHKTNYK